MRKQGSVFYKKSQNLWVVKYKGKWYYEKNQKDAKQLLKSLQHFPTPITEPKRNDVKLYDGISKWLEDFVQYKIKSTSFDRIESTLRNQIKPYKISKMSIYDITNSHIQEWMNELYNENYSYSTLRKAFQCVNKYFNYLQSIEVLINPIKNIAIPQTHRKDKSDIVYYSKDELEVIYSEADSALNSQNKYAYNSAVFKLLANTGLRAGELLALTWQDVDFDKRLLMIDKNVVYVKNRADDADKKRMRIVQSTKTRSGKRKIPLNQIAIDALNILKPKEYTLTQNIILNTRGNPATTQSLDRTFKRILKNCNLPTYGIHALRHTFATLLFQRGVPVKTVSELLGHSDVYITMQIYIHCIPKDFSDAVAKLE